MVKDGSQSLHKIIFTVFNEVAQLSISAPSSWRKSRLTVIFKKGDRELPENYRPIALLSIRTNFSVVCCAITWPDRSLHDKTWKKDRTEDRLLAAAMLTERSYEYKMPMWIATVDFGKAFDTVEQPSLWCVLLRQGVHGHYVTLLKS